MTPPAITINLSGTTYRISAQNPEAIKHIAPADRAALIELLKAIEAVDGTSGAEQQRQAEAVISAPDYSAGTSRTGTTQVPPMAPTPERMGSGDVDALMAKLKFEEESQRKPGLNKSGLYKGMAILLTVIVVLVIIL